MSGSLAASVQFFIGTFSELLVLFVLISMLVYGLQDRFPASRIQALLSGGSGYFSAAALGAITPFCSCSTLPMLVGMLRARADFGPVMTFLFTSPLLNPMLVVLLFTVFGATLTMFYAAAVLLVALTAGYLLAFFNFQRFVTLPQAQTACCAPSSCCPTTAEATAATTGATGATTAATTLPATVVTTTTFSKSAAAPLADDPVATVASTATAAITATAPLAMPAISLFYLDGLLRRALQETRTFLPHLLLGVVVGAVIHGYVPTDFFSQFNGAVSWYLIPAAALLGIPLYVRASSMIPLALSLVGKGMSYGSVMALTIGGAGASLPELIILKRIFQWPLLLAFIGVVFITACVTGFSIDALV